MSPVYILCHLLFVHLSKTLTLTLLNGEIYTTKKKLKHLKSLKFVRILLRRTDSIHKMTIINTQEKKILKFIYFQSDDKYCCCVAL